jgi:mRNA interferase MazF
MKRGDVVVVGATGDYGKPRPAVIVQTDAFPETHISVVVCQMTSEVTEASDFRVTIDPSERNGLRTRSQIMADKPVTVRRVGRTVDRPPRRGRHWSPQHCVGLRYGSRGLTQRGAAATK